MTRTDRFAAEEVVENNAGYDYYDSTSDGAADPRAGSHSRTRASLLADRVEIYGSALKQVLSPMGNDPTEIAQYFENYENIVKRLRCRKICKQNCYCHFFHRKHAR